MSTAFIKEQDGGRWEAPVVFAYGVRAAGEPDVLLQSDDLLEVLHWLERQEHGSFELRDRAGLLLAVRQEAATLF